MQSSESQGTRINWFTILIVLIAVASTVAFTNLTEESDSAMYEIRSYYIQADQLENYKNWIGTHGLPHIRQHMEVVGFWVKGDVDAQISGVEMDELGPANVTWVIKWADMEAREAGMAASFSNETWQKIFAKFPGGREAYLRTEVRFFDAL